MCSSDIVCVVVIVVGRCRRRGAARPSTGRPGARSASPTMSTVSSALDALVVVGVGEREREHALLLQVGLGDAGERAHDHRAAVHVARLHRRVLTRRALAVVLVADRDPRRCRRPCSALARSGSGTTEPSRTSTPDARLVERERVVHADEEVAGDVGEVAAVLQPRAGRRDVVGGALAHRLHQHLHAGEVVAVPRGERLEQLEPIGARAPRPRRPSTGRPTGGWKPGLAGIEALGRQLVGRSARSSCTSVPSGAVTRLAHEVDVEPAGERHRGDGLG